ncbi:unnamed protein product [Owenia fusiformis]|uniref:Uncharacterized protein n=1 Tax=Owenia fusiformis TaxID=6347 RepID=A0A8J1XKQ0_OWEFU|nr:unnamed protein product [Owenia fusiformis]
MYGASIMIPRYQVEQGDRYFNDRPMSWVGGALFMGACAAGHFTLVTIDTRHLTCQANPATVLKILQEERVAFALLLPYILYDLLKLDDSAISSDLSALKVVLTTGQRLDINMIEKFKAKTSANVTMGYGITEVNGAVSVIFPYGDFYKQHTTVGYPSEHSEVSIQNYMDKSLNRIMPINTSGEICIRGPGIMTCYLNNPVATKEAIDEDGWYHTGDVGTMTPYGYITITGRLSHFIKRGTVIIQPAKIEAELMKHPKIHNVQVIGVSDPRLFEELCACLIPEKDCNLTEEEIRQWCDSVFSDDNLDGLSSAPKYFIFLEKCPVKPNGKTDTLALKELAKEKFGLD